MMGKWQEETHEGKETLSIHTYSHIHRTASGMVTVTDNENISGSLFQACWKRICSTTNQCKVYQNLQNSNTIYCAHWLVMCEVGTQRVRGEGQVKIITANSITILSLYGPNKIVWSSKVGGRKYSMDLRQEFLDCQLLFSTSSHRIPHLLLGSLKSPLHPQLTTCGLQFIYLNAKVIGNFLNHKNLTYCHNGHNHAISTHSACPTSPSTAHTPKYY